MIEAIYVLKGTFSGRSLEQFSDLLQKHYKDTAIVVNLQPDTDLVVYGNGPQPTEVKGKDIADFALSLIDTLPYQDQRRVYKALYAKGHRI